MANNILEHCSESFFNLFSVSALPSNGTYTGSKLFRTSTPKSATFILNSGRTIIFFKSDLPANSDPALGRSLTWPVWGEGGVCVRVYMCVCVCEGE